MIKFIAVTRFVGFTVLFHKRGKGYAERFIWRLQPKIFAEWGKILAFTNVPMGKNLWWKNMCIPTVDFNKVKW